MRREEQLDHYESTIEKYRMALEESVCLQHLHEGNGGCHGPCPVCLAAQALGLHKYFMNPGDQERVLEFRRTYGYVTEEEYQKLKRELPPVPVHTEVHPCEGKPHEWFGNQCVRCRQFKAT